MALWVLCDKGGSIIPCTFLRGHDGPCSYHLKAPKRSIPDADMEHTYKPKKVPPPVMPIVLGHEIAQIEGEVLGWHPSDDQNPDNDVWVIECPGCKEQFKAAADQERFEIEHNCEEGTFMLVGEKPYAEG